MIKQKSSFYDLREETVKEKDCFLLIGHPVVVIIVFVIGLLVILWAAYLSIRYYYKKSNNNQQQYLTWLWYVSNTILVMLSTLSFVVPSRMRVSFNLYGLLFVLLLIAYIILMLCFPPIPLLPPNNNNNNKLSPSEPLNLDLPLIVQASNWLWNVGN